MPENQNEKIIGTWVFDMRPFVKGEIRYEFMSDGTYNYINTDSGVRVDTAKYSISGNIITYGNGSSSEFVVDNNSLKLTPVTPQRLDSMYLKRV